MVSRVEVQGAMQTPDGAWRVEAVRRIEYGAQRATQSDWYRILHGDSVIDYLSIGEVQRILAQAGVDMSTLVEAA